MTVLPRSLPAIGFSHARHYALSSFPLWLFSFVLVPLSLFFVFFSRPVSVDFPKPIASPCRDSVIDSVTCVNWISSCCRAETPATATTKVFHSFQSQQFECAKKNMVKKTTKTLEGTTQLPWERGAQIWFIPVRQTLSKTVGFLQKNNNNKNKLKKSIGLADPRCWFPYSEDNKIVWPGHAACWSGVLGCLARRGERLFRRFTNTSISKQQASCAHGRHTGLGGDAEDEPVQR